MLQKLPILLSFYALSNGNETLIFGQLSYTPLRDISFKDYNRRKTFRTLLSLYQTKPYSSEKVTIVFDATEVSLTTNSHGAFYEKYPGDLGEQRVQKMILSTGQQVKLMDGMYQNSVHRIKSNTIIVSDIDDTLMHSFISKRILKFRTLMFTSVEKRKAVVNMQAVINYFVAAGAEPFYLSNSEQNLYPLIFRFLFHNKFPPGPLFLKQMRKLKHVLFNIKFPPKHTHKTTTLEELLTLFPDKQFVLMGDNTQQDLTIYLSLVDKFGKNIQAIVIRKVVERKEDQALIEKASDKLKENNIELYYAEQFPVPFSFNDQPTS
jgi:phosphatidate phosphatase APP1